MSISTAESFLKNFFAARRLTRSDGRPLYRYHLRAAEFDQLGKVLSSQLGGGLAFDSQLDFGMQLSGRRIGPKAAMAFCLWASDWLHRNYKGGPRSWRMLLVDLDRPEFGPGNSRYEDLQSLVIRGIRRWGRTIQRAGPQWRYLDTLLWEGGIPNHLVRERAHLRDYLGEVLEEFRIFGMTGIPHAELAERPRKRLLPTWRRDVIYELAGDLIAGIWRLQSELGVTMTPVKDLDRIRPDWRDGLPIRMSDAAARALLNGLVVEANEVSRRTRTNLGWDLKLVQTADERWTMKGSLRVPRLVSEESLQRLFAGIEVPGSFQLKMQTPSRSLGLVAKAKEESVAPEGRVFHVDRIGQDALCQRSLTKPRKLVMQDTQGTDLGSTDLFRGSSGLNELPWVFVRIADSDGPARYRFAGSGSVRVREPWVVIAVAPGTSVASLGGTVLPVGTMGNADRALYRVRGKAVATDEDGSEALIETLSTADTRNIEYHPVGNELRFGDGEESTFLGGVVLHQRLDGEPLGRVREQHLQWKPDVPGGRYEGYTRDAAERGAILGRGRLRILENGETRYSTSLTVLPPEADVGIRPSAEPNRGEIELVGFGNVVVGVDGAKSCRAAGARTQDGYRLALSGKDDVPREVTVVVDWLGRARARLKLPFPAKRAGFVTPDGRPLPEGTNLAGASLADVKAEVFVPEEGRYQLQGILGNGFDRRHRRDVFVREIPSRAFGHYELDLGSVSREVTERLDSTSDPYAQINLRIVEADSGAPFPSALVFVSRFDLSFTCEDSAVGLVELTEESFQRVVANDLSALEVEMLALLEPEAEPIPVRRSGSAAWRIPTSGLEPGPYLVCGRHGDMQRVRPLRWYVGDPADQAGVQATSATSVAEAYARALVDHHRFREKPFIPVVEAMAVDPGHEGWRLVTGYLQWDEFPITTFPLLRALIENPVACAMAAATTSGEENLKLLWRLERFPFAWWQIPLCAWQEAYTAFAKRWRELLNTTGDSDMAWDILFDLVGRSIACIRGDDRLPGLTGALGFLRADVCEEPLSDEASRCCRPEIIRLLQDQYREHRNECPARWMAPHEIPPLPGMRQEAIRFMTDHQWCSLLFRQATARAPYASERTDFENAPAYTALSVLVCKRPSNELARAIRQLRDGHSEWFDEALRLASLIAFGNRERHRINRKKEGSGNEQEAANAHPLL